MLLSVLLSKFLEDRSHRCVPRIVQWYHSHLKRFIAFAFELGFVCTDDVTQDLLELFISAERDRDCLNRKHPLSPVTIRQRVIAIKTMFAWAKACGVITVDPCAAVVIPKRGKRLPKALSPDQIKKLLSVNLSSRERAVLFLILDSGLRLAEVAALELDDVDIQRGLARVRHGKGDKERWVVFGSETRSALDQWIQERARLNGHCAKLFTGEQGALSTSGVYQLIKKTARRANLGSVVAPHKLRHTFATEYLNGGGSIYDLSALLGHTDIRTTMIYVSVSLEHLQQQHARYSPIKRLSGE
jgi:site-specific recombinase XerD